MYVVEVEEEKIVALQAKEESTASGTHPAMGSIPFSR